MSNKNTVESQGDIRVIKGERYSIIKSLFYHFILVIALIIASDLLLAMVSNTASPDLFRVSIFVSAVIGFVLWIFRARAISKANFDYVIDLEQRTFEFPTSGLGRESVALESIENVYLDTNKSKGSDGKTETNYHLNVTGTFGARSLQPPSKLARDELRGALKEVMKKTKK